MTLSERAALYARVSTARQEQEQTIASQVAALERAAVARGLAVAPARRYLDEGDSGSYLDRPGLDALRDAAANGLLDRVFVYCPDRLARNFVHQQIVLEELATRGVAVDFVEHPIGERPEDRLLVQRQGVVAEYERTKILERTRRGRIHKVRAGQMLPFSHAPYGYAIERSPAVPHGVVVVNEIEAAHVRAMYRGVVDEGLSARRVAKGLNAQGVPPRRARRWVAGSVHVVLTNPAYTGVATTVDDQQPLTITWTGGHAGDDVVVLLSGEASAIHQAASIRCRFDATAGQATIPVQILAAMPSGASDDIQIDSEQSTTLTRGGYTLRVGVRDDASTATRPASWVADFM